MRLNNVLLPLGLIFLGLFLFFCYTFTYLEKTYTATLVGIIFSTILTLYLLSNYQANPFSKNKSLKVLIIYLAIIMIGGLVFYLGYYRPEPKKSSFEKRFGVDLLKSKEKLEKNKEYYEKYKELKKYQEQRRRR
jgi:membrane protease YdiL (CAAX protease family)